MKNQLDMLATALFALAFLVFGLLDILENPVIIILMVAAYLLILGKVIFAVSRSYQSDKKTTPERGS